MAKLQIIESFQITGRGLVILGNIKEGKISEGDLIKFNDGDQIRVMKISAINYVDKAPGVAHISLFLEYKNETEKEQLSKLKLKNQEAEVLKG